MAKKKKIEDIREVTEKGKRLEALINISKDIQEKEKLVPVSFNDFLYSISEKPFHVFRNIFQLFHDMVDYYVGEGFDERPDDEHNVGFIEYDFSDLFVKDCDDPFFADRLFANRFMNLVRGFKKGIQNNRIYLFVGPAGSGKSTFLNNLLNKLEEFTKLKEGMMYETLWHIDIEKLGDPSRLLNKISENVNINGDEKSEFTSLSFGSKVSERFLDIGCPSHDHPILQIPKSFRKKFLDELITSKKVKEKLFYSKEYEWVLKDNPCSICASIYKNLFDEVGDPIKVFNMLNARKMLFNRQFGVGISVYNPGDERLVRTNTNTTIQNKINDVFKTDEIKYIYSDLANTNNGVLALMDIKENNIKRLKGLHGIISDGVHKVETIEEQIKSLFVGLVNPEDKKHFENVKSFQDRIIDVNVPYVLDYRTEVAIYKSKFGEKIENWFLPGVLDNFSKIIVSSRMNLNSKAIKEWIKKPEIYKNQLDKHFLLLKMDIYTGKVPEWLTEEDLKGFKRNIRKEILAESELEGQKGFSGRKSQTIFNSFLMTFAKSDSLFTMENVKSFFEKDNDLKKEITDEFLNSLIDLYNYNVLQEVKESIYYYNEEQISKDIQNYLYCVNFENDNTVKSEYTNDIIEVNEDFFKNFEAIFLGSTSLLKERQSFRRDIQSEYITNTLSQEINVKDKKIEETELFKNLFHKYTRNLKNNALAPYAENDNFKRAIDDFGTDRFKKYDRRLKSDIERMIKNLQKKFSYDKEGARQIALYVVKNEQEKDK